MAYATNVPRDTTMQKYVMGLAPEFAVFLDGTAEGYKLGMRKWFYANGVSMFTTDSSVITEACEKWYELTRDDWNGWTTFYQPDISAVTTGERGGDNEDLSCTPSTDTTEGEDDYAGLPLFACVDVNYDMDATTLKPVITAIDGITANFVRTDPDILVGVMQMAGWHWWSETDETYTHGYSAQRALHVENIESINEVADPDTGIFSSQFVVHTKYMAHLTTSNTMTSCSGVIPTTYSFSHNTLHTYASNTGTGHSGTTSADDAFLKLMCYIKYASLTLDGILQGGCSFNYQYYSLYSEEATNRILVSTAAASYFEVGMSVILGNYSTSTDRSYLYSISGKKCTLITAIETVTITDYDETDTEYCAIYVDMDMLAGDDLNDDGTFDTAANEAATEGTTYISSMPWITGTTDKVLGNDGSMTSNTSGKYPAKLQGIEYMNGCYEILADTIYNLYSDDDGVYYYQPYVCRQCANYSTSITSNYEAVDAIVEQPESSAYRYIKKLYPSGGTMFPTEVDGSSSTYTRDSFYMNAATTGTREYLARGYLSYGSGVAGLSYVNGISGLSHTTWSIGARLSASGTRGEFTP